MAAPDAKTLPLDTDVPLQCGDIGQERSETGDSFFYVGRAIVHVAAAGRSSLVPAPQPVVAHTREKPVSGD